MLLNVASTAVIVVEPSKPSSDTRRIDSRLMSTYKMKYPLTARTVSCPTTLPSMRMTFTVRG